MVPLPLPLSAAGHAQPARLPGYPRRALRRGNARGFTLVELMVTLAVLVVVLALAAPSMSDFTASNRLGATKSALAASLALARSEAARTGQPVLVVALGDGGSGNEYAGGWELVTDQDGSGSASASEPRVRRYPPPDARLRVGGSATVAFRPTGALAGTSAQVFTLCRSDGTGRGYRITVEPSGVADVATTESCA